MSEEERNPFLNGLRREIRNLQHRIAENGIHGRRVELTEMTYDNGQKLYKVFDVDGEDFDPEHPLDRVAGGGLPKPVLVSVGSYRKAGEITHKVYDCAKEWGLSKVFDCALTKRGADRKMYQRAKKIAEFVAKSTGLPLVERTSRYSGVVETA